MELHGKEWFVIPTHPEYLITKDGEIMGKKMKKLLARRFTDVGYLAVLLQNGKRSQRCYVHDLLAETFLGGRDYTKTVVYADGDYKNTSINNISFTDADQTPACGSIEGEAWLPVVGYEGLYEVSNKGRVRTKERTILRSSIHGVGMPRTYKAKVKPPIQNRTGYLKVNLCKDGNHKQHLIHQLVAQAFIPNPNGYKCINHIDCNRTNNRVENLEWCTPKMNSQHAVKMGRYDGLVERQLASMPKVEVRSLTDGKLLFIGNTHDVAEKYGYCCSSAISQAIRIYGGRLPRANIKVKYL